MEEMLKNTKLLLNQKRMRTESFFFIYENS